jgi:hypothetical protein
MTLTTDEQRIVLDPGLLPDPVVLGLDWNRLADLREEHIYALAALKTAQAQVDAATAPYRAKGAGVPQHPQAGTKLFKARAAYREAVADALRTTSDMLDEIRERLPEWREALAAPQRAKRAEAERLRARLAELETEDLTAKRLEQWLDRFDPEMVMPGLYPWSAMAATPEPPNLPVGPIQRSFQPEPEGVVT